MVALCLETGAQFSSVTVDLPAVWHPAWDAITSCSLGAGQVENDVLSCIETSKVFSNPRAVCTTVVVSCQRSAKRGTLESWAFSPIPKKSQAGGRWACGSDAPRKP
jgi:hypothetical protein